MILISFIVIACLFFHLFIKMYYYYRKTKLKVVLQREAIKEYQTLHCTEKKAYFSVYHLQLETISSDKPQGGR